MSDPQQIQKPLADKPFVAMASNEKLVFIGKALIFFASGGFIYPKLWVE